MVRKSGEWAPRKVECGYGMSDDNIELDDDIESYLRKDDVDGLKSMLTHPAVFEGLYCRNTLLQNLCRCRAIKCATSLLDGKLGMTVDVNRDKLLHRAAWNMDPELVKLFLRYGARSDVRFATNSFADLMFDLNGMLPLNIVLDVAREMVEMHQYKTLFKWIVSLCEPFMKSALVVSELLMESTGNIEKFAHHYAMEGKLIELAVLLIIAREKVLNGRMMIPQCVRNQILSLIDEQVKLMRECKYRELNKIQQKMMRMSSTALLLEVYERAGNSLEEYRQSQQPNAWREQMEEDVALILKEAGFRLVGGEFEFSIRNWMNNCGFMRTPIKSSQTLTDKSSQFVIPELQMPPQTRQPTNVSLCRGKEIQSGVQPFPMASAFHGTRALSSMETNHVPISILGGHDKASFDAQVKKGTRAVEQNMPKCLPREKLAYVARLVKRGLRSSWFL